MSITQLFKRLGPGLLFAGAAIGVSHIVQSTRAGANYGFWLIGAVIVINLIKFPFFEFGPRYVAATGENLLQGYKRLGKWALWLFISFSVITMFIIMAAIVLVTSSLIAYAFGGAISTFMMACIICAISATILILGCYSTLDKIIKVMIIILSISTLTAVTLALFQNPPQSMANVPWNVLTTDVGLTFLVAFMGWMPAPIEVSAWHSLWSSEQAKETGNPVTLKQACFDFHVGYWGTVVMAMLFIALGAIVMHPKGEVFSGSSIAFAKQVISLYTETLGQWAFPLIVIVASATMLSTTLTCLDAYCRVIQKSVKELDVVLPVSDRWIYKGWMMILIAGTLLILGQFLGKLKLLVDIATIMSFVLAPVFAFLNLKVVTASHVPVEARPSKGFKLFAQISFALITGFAIFFIMWRFV